MQKRKSKLKVRISAVSYLNTLPFLYGLNHSGVKNDIELSLDIPSDCAKKLLNDEVDLGLVPVAILPQLKDHYIISDYCIGANGIVDTVALFSDVPMEDIESIYLDYQSRTSVALIKLLAKEFWKINPKWIPSEKGFESNISGTTAGVVIGDRTFNLSKKYKFDLAKAWKEHTGLPFVFACWVSNKKLPDSFISSFNESLLMGLNNIDAVIQQNSSNISDEQLKDYLTYKIDYNFDLKKKEALDEFLASLAS